MNAPRPLKSVVFLLCLLPLGWLVAGALRGGLGTDPAETLMLVTGEWALRMLLLTLALAPLRYWSGRAELMRLRRMLGLYAFFYACLHLAAFGQYYAGWSGAILLEELAERPYVTVGFAAWLLMLPLAATSTRHLQRRLGRNWRRLHRLVYPAALLACGHLLWQVRSDPGEALLYLLAAALLLLWRLRRGGSPVRSTPAAG